MVLSVGRESQEVDSNISISFATRTYRLEPSHSYLVIYDETRALMVAAVGTYDETGALLVSAVIVPSCAPATASA